MAPGRIDRRDRLPRVAHPVGRLLLAASPQRHGYGLSLAQRGGLAHGGMEELGRRMAGRKFADAIVENLFDVSPVPHPVVARHGELPPDMLVQLCPPPLVEGHRGFDLKGAEILLQLVTGPAVEIIARGSVAPPQIVAVVETVQVAHFQLAQDVPVGVFVQPSAETIHAMVAETPAPAQGMHVLAGFVALQHVRTGFDRGDRGADVPGAELGMVGTTPGIRPAPRAHPGRVDRRSGQVPHVPVLVRLVARVRPCGQGAAEGRSQIMNLADELPVVAVGPFQPRHMEAAHRVQGVVRIPRMDRAWTEGPHANVARARSAIDFLAWLSHLMQEALVVSNGTRPQTQTNRCSDQPPHCPARLPRFLLQFHHRPPV